MLNGADDKKGLVDTIIEISKSRDLSPRQSDCLKDKKGRTNLFLQVQTRSSRGKLLVQTNDR